MSLEVARSLRLLLLVAALGALASGYATVKDARLEENAANVDSSGEALVFMTTRLTNAYKPGYTPTILVTFVQAATGNTETFSFRADKAYATGAGYSEHIVAFKLAPGRYQVRQIRAMHNHFPIIATFEVPVYQMIEVKKPGAYYLGRIEATVVERSDAKLLRAGPVLPLVDQSVSGASGGTFEVKITDRLDEDMRVLGPRYPALTKVTVEKLLLQPWRQPSESDMESLKPGSGQAGSSQPASR